MKKLTFLVLSLSFSGCAASFQPWPGVTQKDFSAVIQQLQANDQALAEAIVKLQPQKPKEEKKK